MTPFEYETVRRALGVPGPITLVPASTNVVDLKTGKAWYSPKASAPVVQACPVPATRLR